MFKIIKFAMKPIHVNNIHVFIILSELLCALSTTSYDVVTLLKMGGGDDSQIICKGTSSSRIVKKVCVCVCVCMMCSLTIINVICK